MLSFEWDEGKNKQNRKKHGIWFEEAKTAFDDPHGRLFNDQEHSNDGEDRFVLIGYSSTDRLLVVIHCLRNNDSTVRLISARKATKRERMFYEKRV
ncbi:BrnT family toxin [bacterium]|nr:BrnT family toxin [bacterium]